MMRLRSNLQTALVSLYEQRRRTLLSALGITVASLAIVLLISIAVGVQADIGRQVDGLGVNLLVVLPGRIDDGTMFSPNMAGGSYLTEKEVASVRKVVGVRKATPLVFVGGGIRREDKLSSATFLIAAQPEWFVIRPTELSEGRFLEPTDAGEQVCVIGSVARESLFGKSPALGKSVTINDRPFKVVGVTQDRSAEDSLFAVGGFENIATIPFETAKKLNSTVQIHRIMIQTAPDIEPKSLVKSVEQTLAATLPKDTFSVLTQQDLLKLIFKVMSILTWLLTGLTSIALVVGGVGILTVMLMSVQERAKEIGVRKAVGARQGDLFQQFLMESAFLAILGGSLGLGVSAVVCTILTRFTDLKPAITPAIIGLNFGVCLLVGTVFGLLPAMRAARSDPVVALRSE